jgi:hypothetical protein
MSKQRLGTFAGFESPGWIRSLMPLNAIVYGLIIGSKDFSGVQTRQFGAQRFERKLGNGKLTRGDIGIGNGSKSRTCAERRRSVQKD